MTRATIIRESRSALSSAVTRPAVTRQGLRIAACQMLGRDEATATGCLRAADALADALEGRYSRSASLAGMLSDMVRRRDWRLLWSAARREVYKGA